MSVPVLHRTDRRSIEALIGPRDRVAFLQQPFAFDPSLVGRQGTSSKPRGLWYACGRSWLDFSLDEQDPGWLEDYLYRFDLDEDRIVRVTTAAGMERFEATFLRGGRGIYDLAPDWAKVKRETGASGVEICPYRSEKRRRGWIRDEDPWYRPWDVASGCLWDDRALRSVTLLARLRPRVNHPLRSGKRGTTPMRKSFRRP